MTESKRFSQRVMPHSRRLYAVAFRFLERQDEAEDLLQDVMLKLWQMREKLPPDDHLLPFMLTMTRNLCIDRLRARQKNSDNLDLVDNLESIDNIGISPERLEHRERLQHLLLLIKQLPPDQARVLRLQAIDDLTTEQISTLLNITPENVRQLLSRARRKLREMAQKQGLI